MFKRNAYIIIQSVINAFGPGVIAGYSAAIKLNNLVITSLTTLGNGVSNYTAQNLGANKPERIKSGFWAGLKLVWLLCIPLIFVYTLAGSYCVAFFINNPSETALQTGKQFLLIVSPFYLVVATKLVTDGILRGAKMMIKFMIATFTDLILRIILAEVFAGFLGTVGIWIAWPIGWTIATVISLIFYRTGIWYKS